MASVIDNNLVVVGMSGGVDSSVCALLLKEKGYNVVGLHMRSENKQLAKEDEKAVREVCDKLGIKLYVQDYSNEMGLVKDYFLSEYKKGRTPNPCVVCNKEVKFKPFIEFARSIGAKYYATGHYARVVKDDNDVVLKKGIDKDKDQSYFLNQLSKEQLSRAIFPLGELTKSEVREIAHKHNLIVANKKESYDVCFIGTQKFKDYIKSISLESEGSIVDVKTSKVVGTHKGLSIYTIGQRRGLGIGGRSDGTGESWYVVDKDIKNNILYVAQGDGELLLSSGLVASSVNWLAHEPINEFNCNAKFRYRQEDQSVKVKKLDKENVYVTFDNPQRAITIGQYVVFYDGDICLGGGVIDKVIK